MAEETKVTDTQTGENTESNTDTTNTNTDTSTSGSENTSHEKTFTQEEVNALISNRLKKEKAKWEKDNKSNQNVDEAQKFENMTAEERNTSEINRLKKELEDIKLQNNRDKLLNSTQKELSNLGLDVAFADFLIGSDAETTKSNLDSFKEKWNNALSTAIDNRIKGKTPTTTTKTDTTVTTLTMDQIKKMSPEEIQKNWDAVNKVLASQKK